MKRFPETLCPCKHLLCLANILFYICKYRVCSVRVSRCPAADWVRPLEASGHTALPASVHDTSGGRHGDISLISTQCIAMHDGVVLVDICVRLAPRFKNLKLNWKCWWWHNSKSKPCWMESNCHISCFTVSPGRCSLWGSWNMSENDDENWKICITLTFVHLSLC